MVPSMRQQPRAQSPKKVVSPGLEDLKTYSSPDILICGNCRELFSNLSDFIDHRRSYCKLRFTCKCSSHNGTLRNEESASLMCALCKESFASAWDLMVHAQAAHMVNIYQLGSKDAGQDSAACSTAGESTAGSTAGSDVGVDMTGVDMAGETGGEASDSNQTEEEPRTELPKENGVGVAEEGEGSSDLMNGASPPTLKSDAVVTQ